MKRDRAAVRAGFKDEIKRSTGPQKGRKQREEASVLRYKIAVVTTEYMQTHIKACLAKLDLDCDFSIYLYEPSDNLYEIYRSIPDGVAGIMTSGNRFARAIQENAPGENRVIVPLALDDAALHRLFWHLQRKSGKLLEPGRIYCDFLERMHISVEEFLAEDYGGTLTRAMNMEREEEAGENLQLSEMKQYWKLLAVWKTGEFDTIVTRFSGLIPLLREQGVRAYCPYPSIDNVRDTCRLLLQEAHLRQMRENQPAEIHINIWLTNPAYSIEPFFESQCALLQQALAEFFSDAESRYILQRNHFGFVVLTDRKMVEAYTRHYSVCRLSNFLARRLDFKVSVGYGIGRDTYQARVNAINATRESKVLGHSYVMDENDKLIGPLAVRDQGDAVVRPAAFSFRTERAGLSEGTVARVLNVLEQMPNQRLTSGELAQALSVARRTASYFLSAMCQAGILRVVDERRQGRGRPEKVMGRADMLGPVSTAEQ